jgi:2-C-methyl-D-erythritol 2,4-cyclodiphosphate synthase
MVGIGYDIHRLVEGRPLFLGGVKFDFPRGLLGHSDGDVLLHAICDALLGAANLGDIGAHFPPDDPRFKNIAGVELLKKVAHFLADSGLEVRNVDAVVICEAPKVLARAVDIKRAVAAGLSISPDAVSVKGKTNEGLGDIGKGEAIAAFAVCEIDRIYDSAER